MSIINCENCGRMVDTDLDAEHEDECRSVGCKTCDGTGRVIEGDSDDLDGVDCPDCIDPEEQDDMSGASEGDR